MNAGFIGCGAGLLAKSMEDSGISVEWGIDNAEIPCKSFKANFPSAKIYEKSITEFAELPQPDIVAITLPCQTFSRANHKNIESPELLMYSLYLIHKNEPKYWFIENVPGAEKWLPKSPTIYKVRACQFGNKQRRERIIQANFLLGKLTPCCCESHEPTVTKKGTGNGKYYGYLSYEKSLELMGFKDKGLLLVGTQSQKKEQLGEGVVYELGYFLGKKILSF